MFLGRSGGKRKYLDKTAHASKKVAENTLTALLREQARGRWLNRPELTVDEYLDEWLKTSAKARVQGYEELLNRAAKGPCDIRKLARHRHTSKRAAFRRLAK